MDDNCGEWVECMGVTSGCGWHKPGGGRGGGGVASGGGIYGCGCKEVYRLPHTTYPYSSCIYLFFFAGASLLFVHFCNVFRSC